MRPYFAILAVAFVALLGIIPSGATQWYLRYPYFDKFLHLAGGFAIALLIASLLRRDIRKISLIGAIIVIIGGMLIIGVGWEVAEYLSNIYFADATGGWQTFAWQYFHGGDLKDTLLDLGADSLGALIFVSIFLPYARRKLHPER